MKPFDKIISITSSNPQVDWHFGNWCQNSCSYCPKGLHANTTTKYDLNLLKDFTTHIENHFSATNGQRIIFHFSGGEPTIQGNFGPYIKYLHSRGHILTLVSNGGRTLRWWEDNGKYFSKVTLSFHTEYTDIDDFCSLINFLISIDVVVNVLIIAHPDNFDKVEMAYNRLEQFPVVQVTTKKIEHSWVDKNPIRQYTAKELDWIKEHYRPSFKRIYPINKITVSSPTQETNKIHPQWIRNFGKNKFKDWECYQGVKNLAIKVNGKIYGAHCQQLYLGTIDEYQNIQWPKIPSICKHRYCTCATDISITKRIV
jgi:sulfatase maturation enzyme AslB (radical SAM superfamily)